MTRLSFYGSTVIAFGLKLERYRQSRKIAGIFGAWAVESPIKPGFPSRN